MSACEVDLAPLSTLMRIEAERRMALPAFQAAHADRLVAPVA